MDRLKLKNFEWQIIEPIPTGLSQIVGANWKPWMVCPWTQEQKTQPGLRN